MTGKIAHGDLVVLLVWAVLAFAGDLAHADASHRNTQTVDSLPSDIAELLRGRNPGGRGGCPESNIFVHGFRYLGMQSERTIWFLGAPDYLCATNSFVSVITSPGGTWTLGQGSREDWRGSRFLAGVPILFQYSSQLGYFLVSEWQVEGPKSFMYYSAEGETWSSVELPSAARRTPNRDCCYAASIHRLCVAEPATVLITYAESADFHASTWVSPMDDSFPASVAWTQVLDLPDDLRCDDVSPRSFIPRSLREKTSDGVIFDLSIDWAVRIPGPTK